jgi:hypothetical protein
LAAKHGVMQYNLLDAGLYTFVLTGQTIDRSFYDNLNSYTDEAGSDGVVRVTAANMNYGLQRLEQQEVGFKLSKQGQSPKTAIGVLPTCLIQSKTWGSCAASPRMTTTVIPPACVTEVIGRKKVHLPTGLKLHPPHSCRPRRLAALDPGKKRARH